MNLDGTQTELGRRPSRDCIAAGTPVETPSGPKTVETLNAGELIWGYDQRRREPVIAKLTAIQKSAADETLQLGDLRLTEHHLVFVAEQWKPAGELKPKDRLLGSDMQVREVGRIEIVPGQIAVFDLTVEPTANYFAGGVLVHDKNGR